MSVGVGGGGGVMIDVVPSECLSKKKDPLFDLWGRLEQKIMSCVCFLTIELFYFHNFVAVHLGSD